MLNRRIHASRLAAVAILLGSLATAPAFAADPTATPDQSATTSAAAPKHMKHETPEQMKQHVENRIETLHAKLMITSDQEASWDKVAQAMRDSEAATVALIHERHSATAPMTAVEDLQSYQKIAQSHADGLAKVVAAFNDLYNSFSDDQKANADKVFGGFEGHGPDAHKHAKTPAAK